MASDILIIGSVAWIILWSIYGLKLGAEHLPWLAKMKGLSKGTDLAEFWDTFDGFKARKTAHAHTTSFAVIAFLVGLAFHLDLIMLGCTFGIVVAIVMLVGIVLGGLGGLFRNVALMAGGNILFLLALIACFIGLFL